MDNIQELSFEQAFDQLEDIIAQLESGELALEKSMQLFERGRLLSDRCQQLLDQAELKVARITDDGEVTSLD